MMERLSGKWRKYSLGLTKDVNIVHPQVKMMRYPWRVNIRVSNSMFKNGL
jgi:hypothetical protein